MENKKLKKREIINWLNDLKERKNPFIPASITLALIISLLTLSDDNDNLSIKDDRYSKILTVKTPTDQVEVERLEYEKLQLIQKELGKIQDLNTKINWCLNEINIKMFEIIENEDDNKEVVNDIKNLVDFLIENNEYLKEIRKNNWELPSNIDEADLPPRFKEKLKMLQLIVTILNSTYLDDESQRLEFLKIFKNYFEHLDKMNQNLQIPTSEK